MAVYIGSLLVSVCCTVRQWTELGNVSVCCTVRQWTELGNVSMLHCSAVD